MKKTLIPAIIAFIAIFLSACQKQPNVTLPVTPGTPADKTVTATFTGKVIDPLGKAVSNVKVTSRNQTTYTDEYGFFRLKNISASEQFGFIKAEKSGYFPGARTVYSTENSSNYVVIQLITRTLAGTVENGSATISVDGKATITFTQAAFITSSGSSYSGNVNVYASLLDPESSEFSRIMPGDLRGVTSSNSITALMSYGMLAVELEGTGGERLQLASGSKATIRSEIPASLAAKAPASIPLWYFDENIGLWKEEGSATRDGNAYTGEVSHFTYWNYDDPLAFVYLSLQLQDQNQQPLPYTLVTVVNTSDGSYGIGHTDSTGYLKMWVPKNAPLEIRLINDCEEVFFTSKAGPYESDTDFGKLSATIPPDGAVEISGSVVDCSGSAVKNGFANVYLNGLNYSAEIIDGAFTRSISRCSNLPVMARIYVVDRDAMKESTQKEIQVTSGAYNAGQLSACELVSDQYVNLALGDDSYTFTFPPDTLTVTRYDKQTEFQFFKSPFDNNSPWLYFFSLDTIPSTFTTYCNLGVNQKNYRGDTMQVVLTKYGKVNEYIELSMTGNVRATDSSGVVLPVSAALKIRRRN